MLLDRKYFNPAFSLNFANSHLLISPLDFIFLIQMGSEVRLPIRDVGYYETSQTWIQLNGTKFNILIHSDFCYVRCELVL